ncbi:MAG: hypothetical protein AAFO15_02700 [Pseudomonadota bacterium]
MFILASNISVGYVINIDNRLYEVLSKEHVQPGKGGAYLQLALKDYLNKKKKAIRVSGSDKIEKMNIYIETMQPLYEEGTVLVLLDNNHEERRMDLHLLNEQRELFSLDHQLTVYICNNEIIKATLPEEIIVTILETAPYQKNSRSKLGTKPAQISKNISINIPSNLNGGQIIINTNTLTFVKKHIQNV